MARIAAPKIGEPRSGRALVRNLAGPAAAPPAEPELIVEARTAYDFLISLLVDTESELLPADQAWLDVAKASLSEGLKRDLARTIHGPHDEKGLGTAVLPLILADPSIRGSADVVALAGRIGPLDLLREACCTDDQAAAALPFAERYLAGETKVLPELLAAVPKEMRPAVEHLVRDPDGYLRAFRRVLRAWRERFEAIEGRLGRMLEQDVAGRRADLGRLPLADFVEKATGGVRWSPDPNVRRLVLTPSYFARPYNYVFGERDWHMLCYPLAETALDGDASAVPAATVRLFRALGDESRLRILRYLADGDLYLTEIAERMGLSKPTISHHMAQLRAVGLVTTTEAGGLTYYSLRRERLADLGPDVARYLGGSRA